MEARLHGLSLDVGLGSGLAEGLADHPAEGSASGPALPPSPAMPLRPAPALEDVRWAHATAIAHTRAWFAYAAVHVTRRFALPPPDEPMDCRMPCDQHPLARDYFRLSCDACE